MMFARLPMLLLLFGQFLRVADAKRLPDDSRVHSLVAQDVSSEAPETLVEVRAGTDSARMADLSNGNVLPSMKRPWGFNDWAPQTNVGSDGWWFVRHETSFRGLRCAHEPSPWIGDYAGLLVTPHLNEASVNDVAYSPEEATFMPHLFKATLTEESGKMDFEFTPTSHGGLFRVSFGEQEMGHVTIKALMGEVTVKDGYVSGNSMLVNHGMPETWKGMFFVVKPVSKSSGCKMTEGGLQTLSAETARCDFQTSEGHALLAIATSFISEEQALRNFELEVSEGGKVKDFDVAVTEGRDEWRARLNTVKVKAQDETQLKVFYTNLWRSQLFPRIFSEIDAEGKEVHISPVTGDVRPGKLVTDSGFWDAYRTVYTLQSLIARDTLGQMVDGWLSSYDEAGWVPQWASPDSHGSMMVGTMGDVVLADAIAKSEWGLVEGFNVSKAYEAVRKDAFQAETGHGRMGLEKYIKDGYLPFKGSAGDAAHNEAVAITLGYYQADAAIANAARALNKIEDAETLLKRSKRYGEIFNPETHFFQPMDATGKFTNSFDPLDYGNGFTEGNAWHFRFDVPHDVEGLNHIFDGKLCDAVAEMLSFTGKTYKEGSYGRVTIEMSEAEKIKDQFGLYAHSNQPVHHVLWIAKKAGCNELADRYLRRTMDQLYTTTGWSGDEDNGEMAAWYVLSALGIYQIEGGKDELILGSPAVVEADVDLGGGKTLKVLTEGQSKENVYTHAVEWTPSGGDAVQLSGNTIRYTDLMKGGTLKFSLASMPK